MIRVEDKITENIIQLLFDLNWNDVVKQQNAIIELTKRTDYDLRLFIAPLHYELCKNHDVWWKDIAEGCARVINNKSDKEIITALPELFVWFQDLNWPGGDIVAARLKKIPYFKIEKYVNETIIKAQQKNDDEWVKWLSCLTK